MATRKKATSKRKKPSKKRTCKTAGKSLGKAGGYGKSANKKGIKKKSAYISKKTKTTKGTRSIMGSKLRSCR